MYLEDWPSDKLRMPPEVVFGVPALDVPQYWQRAAGFDDTFIAHTESKHLVRFICEHVAAMTVPGQVIRENIKNRVFFFISLFPRSISKNNLSEK